MSSLITYYLEMLARPNPRSDHTSPYQLIECVEPQPEFNEFLYRFVGRDWEWTDRLNWSPERWLEHVSSEHLRTWVAYYAGAIAGYFELRKEGADVEILYFGLAPGFIGKGFGKRLLEDAIDCAWDWPLTDRVWLHTCNLDHPGALRNYQSRGFQLYKITNEPLKA